MAGWNHAGQTVEPDPFEAEGQSKSRDDCSCYFCESDKVTHDLFPIAERFAARSCGATAAWASAGPEPQFFALRTRGLLISARSSGVGR